MTKKDSLEIFEIEANEKTAIRLQSNFLQNNIQYQIVTINSENQIYSYLLEIFGDKDSALYPETITKLDFFKGTLNVFSLKGKN
ncbi:hypothetical protein [Flavobacterium sp. KJJ]|uniref:hypothetical protein n=1 Tax=Flavobacterium sp. KJJ TaxID=1270193 RepID=UPI000493437F|nr:hypothetical protein [Flavobacterium sp. KJJ]